MIALVVHTTKSRQEMLEDVDLGDGNGAFKVIYRTYYRNTTSGYQAAILAFYAGDMAKDEVDIMGFGQLITRRAKQLIALGGQSMEKDKITVLLSGLRPEFALCKTQLKIKTLAEGADARVGLTFREALNELRDFAIEESLDKLGGGSAEKAAAFSIETARNAVRGLRWPAETDGPVGADSVMGKEIEEDVAELAQLEDSSLTNLTAGIVEAALKSTSTKEMTLVCNLACLRVPRWSWHTCVDS
jgi:hypothetical protein